MSRPKLTIAHVQTRFLRAGAEENTWASCRHQKSLGHNVHLLCGPGSDFDFYRGQNSGVHIHLIPSLVREISPRLDMKAVGELRRALKDLSPDIVHTHTSKAGILGRLAAKAVSVPTIIHGVHMLPFDNVGTVEKMVYLTAEHAVAPLTDHFIHVSHGTREAYRRAAIGRRTPHSVVRSGMDVGAFSGAEWPDDWRALLGVAANEPKPRVILMLAALEPRKRHQEFLLGFDAATGRGDPIRVLLAGEGPERDRLGQMIAERGLDDRVRLAGHRKDPERLVALADIGVLASLREGLPRVVVQYLAGGRPAVVSAIQGIEEVVTPGVNGEIVYDKDAGKVAREAVHIIRDAPLLARLSAGAVASPTGEWSHASMFEQLDRAYAITLESA